MPTFTNTPQKGFTKPSGPPRKPQPGVNVHPDSRLAQAAEAKQDFTQRKDPFLLAHGFNGTVDSFNRRVDKAYNGYTNAYGKEPSPGLIWDVVRNPKVMDDQIPDLFRIPLDSRQVKPEQDHFESSWNGEGLHDRGDGRVQRTNPITAYHATEEFHHQELQNKPPVMSVKDWHKLHPILEAGMFPGMPFLTGNKGLWADYHLLEGNINHLKETLGGFNSKQLSSLIAGSGMPGSQLVGQEAGVTSEANIGAQRLAQQAEESWISLHPGDDAGGKRAYNQTLAKYMKPALQQEALKAFGDAKQRNDFRHEWLINHDSTGIFNGLTWTGKFTKDWMVAIDKWQRTPGASYLLLQNLATQNEFNPTTAGIHAMEAAFKEKEAYVNSKQALPDKWIAQSLPLKFFSNHTFPDWFTKDSVATMLATGKVESPKKILDSFDQSMKDWWSYSTTGISNMSWLVFPVGLLQAGYRQFQLGYNAMNGAWNQGIADATGTTTVLGDLARGKTTEQITKDMFRAVQDNPDMVRMLGFGTLPQHMTGSAAVADQIANVILQTAAALTIRGPGFFKLDESKALAEWKRNPFLWLANRIAYTHIKAGDLGAAEMIFGGRAADPFIHAMEKQVREEGMTFSQFHHNATEFARSGQTTLPDGSVFGGHSGAGGIHASIWDKNMPKHVTGLVMRNALKKTTDRLETSALANRSTGTLGKFLTNTRTMLQIAQPLGKVPPIYELDVRGFKTFINENKLMSEAESRAVVRKFINARATENTARMDKVLQTTKDIFEDKYKLEEGKKFPAEYEHLLSTEGLVNARFPTRQGRLDSGWQNITIKWANETGRYWRTTIQATGPGLFYKHATRDPIAALLGGMKLVQTPDMKRAAEDMAALEGKNLRLLRLRGSIRHSVIGSETVWANSLRLADGESNFKLMDEIHKTERSRWILKMLGPKPNKEISVAAAEFLRKQVMDPLYPLYEDYLRTGDKAPLVEEALHNRDVYVMMQEATRLRTQLNKVKREFKDVVGHGQMQIPGTETEHALKEALRSAKKDAASAYIEMVLKRFDGIREAAKQAGVPDLMEQASNLQRTHAGQADQRLADLLLKHQVNITVPDGTIIPMSRFDRVTSSLIHKYMLPNRMARQRMFDHMTQQYYSHLVKAGWDPEQAYEVSMQAAKTATQFHLLDFSNMLEFERKYRGFLPFFTKHRLFIKWLLGTFVHRPGLVVPLHTISQHLDQYGRLNFNLPIPGLGSVPVNVNFLRLMFLSSETQPATVPLLNFIPGVRGSPLASQWTRFDPLIKMWGEVALHGFSYDSVVGSLDPYTRARVDQYMALYAIRQRLAHGIGSYVSPREAFKYAAMRVSIDLPLNATMVTPVGISNPLSLQGKKYPLDVPRELAVNAEKYDKLLVTNPQAAANLLNNHPEIGLLFGKADNFNVYNHMTQMWGMYDQIHQAYAKVEDKYSKMELEGKTLTPADYKAMHAASVKYSQQINSLRALDAQLWNHDTGSTEKNNWKGEAGFPGVNTALPLDAQYGPWYTQFSHDPLGAVDALTNLFGGKKDFSAADLHNIYGEDLVQAEVTLSSKFSDGATKAAAIKDIERLQGAKKITANETFYQAYNTAYTGWEKKFFDLRAKAKQLGGVQGATLYWKAAQLMRQQYEHPYVTLDGKQVKVLPFAEYMALKQTPAQKLTTLIDSVKFPYQDMSLDQRIYFGLPGATPAIDSAWADYSYNVKSYETQTGKTISRAVEDELAIAINKTTPGFWKDYLMSKEPRSFILYNYGKGEFATGKYGKYWKQLAQYAAEAYNRNKYGWSAYVNNTLDPFIRSSWPPGFVKEYEAAGGVSFLINLNTPWG